MQKNKAVFFEELNHAVYREIKPSDIYLPTLAEQHHHGVNIITRPLGAPGPGEIQVQAVVGAICTHEVSIFNGDLTVPRFPWLAGHEAVHRVTAIGKGVQGFQEGDWVSCCWYHGQWCNCLNGPASQAYRLPGTINDPALWLIEPAASVVNAAGYFNIQPGDRVLLIGAGFMGLLIVQLLNHYPLAELVVVEIKEFNRKLAKKCGAHAVVNPIAPNWPAWQEEAAAKPYDIAIECSGTQSGLDTAIRLTRDAGSICLFGWHRQVRQIDLSTGHLRGHRILNTSPGMDAGRAYERHWPATINLIKRGVFNLAPLISHRYQAKDIQQAMQDFTTRREGFIKSVFEL